MNKLLLISLLILVSSRLLAQDYKASVVPGSKDQSATKSSPGVSAFKAQSSSSTASGKTDLSAKPAQLPVQTPKASDQTNKNNTSLPAGNLTVSEILKTDYSNMPEDVKSMINSNKALGKNLLEGIAKGYEVRIPACTNDTELKKTLSFLHNSEGFINSEFVSPGLIRIIVEPSFDSPELKNLLSGRGLEFNFLNRFYLLNK